jgi:hypothetical protein
VIAVLIAFSVTIWILFLSGCASIPTHNISPPIPTTPTIIWNTVRSTDWLFSLLLIGSVAGVFAGLNGMKSGWMAVAACISGLFLKAALTSTWVYWFCGLLFVGSLTLGIVSIIWKNNALKDLIVGGNYLKQHVDTSVSSEIFKTSQSKDTVVLVNNIKAKLKTKGIL